VPVKGVKADSMISALTALGVVDSTDAAVLRRLALQQVAPATNVNGAPRDGAAAAKLAAEKIAESDGSRLFGLELFSGATSQFDANAGGPVDASYRLGPGDQLVLILTGDIEEAYTLDVTREGFIVVPAAGEIPIANLTLGELDGVLRKRLGRVFSGIGSTTRFTVSVARLRSNQVFVVGDVRMPGSHRVSSAGTALSALYAAAGPSERGSLRAIQIRRRGHPAQTFDVYDHLIRGDASGDIRLENGDVLFVPAHGARVRMHGGVLRPATYELRAGETLDDLVRSAGGFSEDASQRQVRIQRIVPPAQRTAEGCDRIVLDGAAPAGPGNSLVSVRLEARDIVEVMRSRSACAAASRCTAMCGSQACRGSPPGSRWPRRFAARVGSSRTAISGASSSRVCAPIPRGSSCMRRCATSAGPRRSCSCCRRTTTYRLRSRSSTRRATSP
jgi:protein involved in polysaccharide export with SLBB domain